MIKIMIVAIVSACAGMIMGSGGINWRFWIMLVLLHTMFILGVTWHKW